MRTFEQVFGSLLALLGVELSQNSHRKFDVLKCRHRCKKVKRLKHESWAQHLISVAL